MSSGQVLTVDSGPAAIGHFGAAASLVNAAEQFVPPFNGAATSLTRLAGVLVAGGTPPTGTAGTGEQRTIRSLRISYTGDVANAAGQTITVQMYKRTRGTAVWAAVGDTIAGIATTAGQQEGVTTFATSGPVNYEPGDEIGASITPSALLTAVLTNISIAVGS